MTKEKMKLSVMSLLAAGVFSVSGIAAVHAADMPERSGSRYVPAASKNAGSGYGKYSMDNRSGGAMNSSYGKPGSYPSSSASSSGAAGNWSGLYVGANGGYAWARLKAEASAASSSDVEAQFGTGNYNGLTYGGQVGYLADLDGNIVAGVEADVVFTDELKLKSVTSDNSLTTSTFVFDYNPNWIATGRARIGSVMENWMVYGTGGVALSTVSVAYKKEGKSLKVEKENTIGWSAGGGVELLLSDNLTTRLEYLYYNLGKDSFVFKSAADQQLVFDGGKAVDVGFSMHSVRLGVNLKF